MEYAIYPMNEINISQRHNGTTSHRWYTGTTDGCKAIDNAGTGTANKPLYAPTTMKILWIHERANSVAFGTCDSAGNPAKVKCENGEERVLTFMFAHMNSDKMKELDLYTRLDKNPIFKTGETCYYEGGKRKLYR